LASPSLVLKGIHCHIGSQIFGLDSFARATELMVEFMASVRDAHGVELPELDMGGGLGIAYTSEDTPPTTDELAEVIAEALLTSTAAQGLGVPRLILEPGRSIVGPAGVTLYTVGPVKEIPGVRTYVAVDGGLSDNPRPALYGAEYEAIVANKANLPRTMPVRVAGKHCETDTLIPEIALQAVEEGDVLAVFCTGAYNYAMASNYNRFPRPAMVLVRDGKADVIVEREGLEDLVRHDRIPARLAR
jgi:diaminopimelate decarboxylase